MADPGNRLVVISDCKRVWLSSTRRCNHPSINSVQTGETGCVIVFLRPGAWDVVRRVQVERLTPNFVVRQRLNVGLCAIGVRLRSPVFLAIKGNSN